MNIKWGLFDDTPDKVAEALEKARPKAIAATAKDGSLPHNRATAKARLKEARTLLASNQYEQAEAVALDVKSWGLSYGMFEENPEKVAAAAAPCDAATRCARRRPRTSRARASTRSWSRSRGS